MSARSRSRSSLAKRDAEVFEAGGGSAELARAVDEEAAPLAGPRDEVASQHLEEGVDSVDPGPGLLDELREHAHPLGEVALEDLGKQLLLGAEGAVEARFVDAAGVDEIGHRGLGVPLSPEKRGQFVQNGVFVEEPRPASGPHIRAAHAHTLVTLHNIGTLGSKRP